MPNANNQFFINEIEWINRFLSLDPKLSANDIRCILNFSLLWNLFEGLMCNKHASVSEYEKIVHKLQANNIKMDEHLRYFISRYTDSGKVNSHFNGLRLRDKDKPDIVKSVLEETNKSQSDILFTILIIVHRYRNNLFHGEKQIHELPYQLENFNVANQILMFVLESWKSNK